MSFPTSPGLIERIIYALNMEVHEQMGLDDFLPFELITNGLNDTVVFLGYPIWCSEDEKLDDEAVIEPAIRREAMALLDKLRGVALGDRDVTPDPSRQ